MEMQHIRTIDLTKPADTSMVSEFLKKFNLDYDPKDVEYSCAIMRDGDIVATGSFANETIRNVAISSDYQGEGLSFALLSHLMEQMRQRNIFHYFIFTKPETSQLFASAGFHKIAEAEGLAVLLECGLGSIQRYCAKIQAVIGQSGKKRSALVMNCNPFTKGHRYLIEECAKQSEETILFVVEEDRSAFSFQQRMEMVRRGTSDIPDLKIISTDKYAVSTATFPSYFTKKEDFLSAQIGLDLNLFGKWIAPALQITKRYIGSEPYSSIMSVYNQKMKCLLPDKYSIEVEELSRLCINDVCISASQVRRAIKDNDWLTVKQLVPASTYDYLIEICDEESKHVLLTGDSGNT